MISKFFQKEFLRNYLLDTFASCDKGTWEHSLRVGKLCQSMAQDLNLSTPMVSYITLAGLLHDVGKIFMTEMVNFPGKLEEKDRYMISYHPQLGKRLIHINWADLPEQVHEGIHFHHERLTGDGYPFNLKGNDIPLTARIVAVADVFDAMRHTRPYRPALSDREIFRELYHPGYDQKMVRTLMKAYDSETRA